MIKPAYKFDAREESEILKTFHGFHVRCAGFCARSVGTFAGGQTGDGPRPAKPHVGT